MEYSWKLFKRFLKERGLFASYCHNFREQNEVRKLWLRRRGVCDILGINAREYVTYSFEWSKTREGHKFWSDIHSEWQVYYDDDFWFS